MKIKRLMHDQAMHLPRQRRLGATNDSDDDESLFLERPESTMSMSGTSSWSPI